MKKIFNIILLTLAIIGLASCSDSEEGEYTLTNSIKIVSQNVSDMPVVASEGTIVVDAPSAIEAKASADWFTTSVSGRTITVKTTDNTDLQYRSGKITIRSGNDVIDVAVIQKGAIVSVEAQNLYLNDAKADFKIPYVTNLELKCYTQEDWITCKAADGILSLGVAENATGHIRSGYVFYEAGDVKDSIFVQQCELEKDLLGEMMLGFYNNKGEDDAVDAKLVASTDTAGVTSYALVLSDLGFVIPVTLNEKTLTLTLNAGEIIGKYQDYFIVTQFYDLEKNEMTADDKVSVSGTFNYYDKDKVTYLEFADNGSWAGFSASSLILNAYDATGNDVGVFKILHFPYLLK
ncbi:MAG: BACON domain-containing protein [Prevotella sp.]|nr:BACON domain-containing protein [Prevotella sp.]